MVKTRSKPRTVSSRPHYPRTGKRRGQFRLSLINKTTRLYFSILSAGLVIALATWVIVPLAITGTISLLGIGSIALPLTTAIVAFGYKTENLHRLFRPWWRWAGAFLSWLGLIILAGLIFPAGMYWWKVNMAEVSLGGLLGQFIGGYSVVEGMLRGCGLLAAGIVIAFPKHTREASKYIGRSAASVYRGRVLRDGIVRLFAYLGRMPKVFIKGKPELNISIDPPPPFKRKRKADMPKLFLNGNEEDDYEDDLQGEPIEEIETPPVVPVSSTARPSSKWDTPKLDLLDKKEVDVPIEDHMERSRLIEEALSSYGVNCKVVQVQVGPAVTQYGLEPGWDIKYREVKERDELGKVKLDKNGMPKVHLEEVSRTRVKVERIVSLANDLALALAAPSVRIEAPVPGRRVVGIEVPNSTPGLVTLRGVMESAAFQRVKTKSKLAIALGKGAAGEPVAADLARMPHLLIAGATGSGKSVCINSIITAILMNAAPNEVRLMMIDPKRVELVNYNEIPHLLAPVMVDAEKVLGTLAWVLKEMDERYKKFAQVKVRNLEGYNKHPGVTEPLPQWVLIIDELADLMMVAPYEVERSICRLAQLARATGIHLIVATQRPSVDVVTGLIKANFPTRIGFAVVSQVDSRTILDATGAEKLLGRGDMLFMAPDTAKPKRVQGVYVSDQEIERVVNYWTSDKWRYMRPPQFGDDIERAAEAHRIASEDDTDPLYERAVALAAEHTRISTSLLQRKLRIGYPRAARIMEQLEQDEMVQELLD